MINCVVLVYDLVENPLKSCSEKNVNIPTVKTFDFIAKKQIDVRLKCSNKIIKKYQGNTFNLISKTYVNLIFLDFLPHSPIKCYHGICHWPFNKLEVFHILQV